MYKYICTYTYVYVCTCVCVRVRVYMCIHVFSQFFPSVFPAWVHRHWYPDIRGSVSGCGEEDHLSADGAQQHWEDCGDRQSHWWVVIRMSFSLFVPGRVSHIGLDLLCRREYTQATPGADRAHFFKWSQSASKTDSMQFATSHNPNQYRSAANTGYDWLFGLNKSP